MVRNERYNGEKYEDLKIRLIRKVVERRQPEPDAVDGKADGKLGAGMDAMIESQGGHSGERDSFPRDIAKKAAIGHGKRRAEPIFSSAACWLKGIRGWIMRQGSLKAGYRKNWLKSTSASAKGSRRRLDSVFTDSAFYS